MSRHNGNRGKMARIDAENALQHLADNPPLSIEECHELAAAETVIERGLQTFYEVGTALLNIRDKRLYRDYAYSFEEYCRKRWNMSKTHANRLIDASEVISNLTPIGVELPANEAQARELVGLTPNDAALVLTVAKETAPAGKITASHIKALTETLREIVHTGAIDDGSGEQIEVADIFKHRVTEEHYERMKRQEAYIAEKQERKSGTPPALQMSESNEWYTPSTYINLARQLMGGIDTDPASCEFANRVVQAATYYTQETNGLDKAWYGRVWLNPPYGRDSGDSNQDIWSARLLEQYRAGITTEAVLLVNAVTDRKWFQPLWDFPICFTNHRIRFYDLNGESGQPTHGNALVYLGPQVERFMELFNTENMGVVVRRVQ